MNKQIMLSKIGSEHAYDGTNKQDFCIALPDVKLKMVFDGCGSCKFSEVGVQLFAQLMIEYVDLLHPETFEDVVKEIFTKLICINHKDYFNGSNFCFTILACFETDDEFIVYSCGDGYILLNNGKFIKPITFKKLDDGEYPKYYVYNYIIDKESLKEYKDGVSFTVERFSKKEYVNVGVATDGLRYYEDLSQIEKFKFRNFLSKGNKGQISILINRNSQLFKDDIAICF